jgi:hypothetical protein
MSAAHIAESAAHLSMSATRMSAAVANQTFYRARAAKHLSCVRDPRVNGTRNDFFRNVD